MQETCGICGGDGRIQNSFGGSSKTCPGCHGTGRKAEDFGIFRDVTKTKPSHYKSAAKPAAAPVKSDEPTTFEGMKLAKEVNDCANISKETKAKLTREIAEYESTHGSCTQTFTKKIRKQLRAPAS